MSTVSGSLEAAHEPAPVGRRGRRSPRLRSAWRLLALASVSYLVGDIAQTVYELAGTLPYPSVADGFCDARQRDQVKAFFADKIDSYSGGPRNLAHVLETVNTCIAERSALGPQIDEFLRGYGAQ